MTEPLTMTAEQEARYRAIDGRSRADCNMWLIVHAVLAELDATRAALHPPCTRCKGARCDPEFTDGTAAFAEGRPHDTTLHGQVLCVECEGLGRMTCIQRNCDWYRFAVEARLARDEALRKVEYLQPENDALRAERDRRVVNDRYRVELDKLRSKSPEPPAPPQRET